MHLISDFKFDFKAKALLTRIFQRDRTFNVFFVDAVCIWPSRPPMRRFSSFWYLYRYSEGWIISFGLSYFKKIPVHSHRSNSTLPPMPPRSNVTLKLRTAHLLLNFKVQV